MLKEMERCQLSESVQNSKWLYGKQRIDKTTQYRQKNRERWYEKQQVKHEKERRATDKNDSTAILLRQRMTSALARAKETKADTTLKLVGAVPGDVVARLEAHWDKRASSYDIDHIFSFSLYNLDSEQEQRKAMNITNLQPLSRQENGSKLDTLPTKAMAAKVERWAWPPGITDDMLPEIYDGWATPLRMF